MLQDRQVERMVLKVARLEQIYSAFLVKKTIKPKVMMEKNGNVSEIKKGQNIFIKRLIAAAIVFFVVTIVNFLVSIVAKTSDAESISSCIDKIIDCDNPDC